MREVHDFFAESSAACRPRAGSTPTGTRTPRRGSSSPARLLVSIADRLGGPLRAQDFEQIKAERFRWLSADVAPRGPGMPGPYNPREQIGAGEKSSSRRAIHSPVGAPDATRSHATREGGPVGGNRRFPPTRTKTPPAAAPGAFSVRGDTFRGDEAETRGSAAQPRSSCARRRIRRWRPRIRPGVRSVRCGHDYRSLVQKSQVAWSSDFDYCYLTVQRPNRTHPDRGSAGGPRSRLDSDGHVRHPLPDRAVRPAATSA